MSEVYCVKWNDFHSHLGQIFSNLFSAEGDVDVTLRAQGSSFKCHKVVLSASSPYFHKILESSNSSHPLIIIDGVKAADIETIVDFMYHGEIRNINHERFISVLETAETLKINGLTEVTIFQTTAQSSEDDDVKEEENIVLINESGCSSKTKSLDAKDSKKSPLSVTDSDQMNRRMHNNNKNYCSRIDLALKDMEWGMSLMEASRLHKIPRSTLYSKAKHHSGLQIISRKEHTNQDCHPALQAIAGGMSLKRAAEEFNIPKTVLWRRVQKRLDILSKVKCRKKSSNKSMKDYEDALKETLANSTNFIVSPSASSEKDSNNMMTKCKENKKSKKIRLSQAVEACKTGKMSQATASSTFQVPKTTIWRCLQKLSTLDELKPKIVIEKEDHQHNTDPSSN